MSWKPKEPELPPGVKVMKNYAKEIIRYDNYEKEVELPVITRQLPWFNPSPFIYRMYEKFWIQPAEALNEYLQKKKENHQPHLVYHNTYRRAPNIWECDTDDRVCILEAETQFTRDRLIDAGIIKIFANRLSKCKGDHGQDNTHANYMLCAKEEEDVEKLERAWQTKYGDIGNRLNARNCLNKQKNRVIEERYLARTQKNSEEKE